MTTSRAILDTATRLFAEQGYDGTSVSEIAKQTGVATGTVIYQYKSKENLLQVIVWEYFNRLLQNVRRADDSRKGRQALTDYIQSVLEYARSRKLETTVMLLHHNTFRKAPHRFPLAADGFRAFDVCVQQLRDIVSSLFDDADGPREQAEQFMDGVVASMLGACWMYIFAGKDIQALENELISSVLLRLEGHVV